MLGVVGWVGGSGAGEQNKRQKQTTTKSYKALREKKARGSLSQCPRVFVCLACKRSAGQIRSRDSVAYPRYHCCSNPDKASTGSLLRGQRTVNHSLIRENKLESRPVVPLHNQRGCPETDDH